VILGNMKKRIDLLIFEQAKSKSRTEAQSFIMAGIVFVNSQKVLKPGQLFNEDIEIDIRGKVHPFVSRGGLKLEKAIKF